MTPSRDERLAKYRAKRKAGRTPEPFGGEVPVGSSTFVVQKHHARAMHWDLRLELDGVLLSWAVPKGPSPNQADKRLAVQTEDHPLEYAEFEGIIPEGEYGAGSMIVWDHGTWVPVEDPHEGLEKGKLLFDLRGHKLLGRWTLVKTKQAANSWLLIKERDGYMDPEGGTESYPDDSIYSGLTVDEYPRADEHAEVLAARVAALAAEGAKARDLRADDVKLMLATAAAEPFTREGWLFELKYDGYRLLAERRRREPYLRSRAGHDLTVTFPDIARAVRGLPYEGLVLDGEVVVHDAAGLPSFSRLQRRGRILNRRDALRGSLELPATYWAFDLLALEGYDLRGLPLRTRKELLREVLPTVGPIRYSDHIETRGEALYGQVTALRLEGIVGKNAEAPYRAGRSAHWVKVRTVRVEDFIVVGWTEPRGSRAGFGALHLARYRGAELVYMGSVGSGFSDAELGEMRASLRDLEVDACPCTVGPVPKGKTHHWVRPEMVVEVKYKEVTDQGLARQASFSRLRPDKRPRECVEEVEDDSRSEGGTDDGGALPSGSRGPSGPDVASAGGRTTGASGRGHSGGSGASTAGTAPSQRDDRTVPFTNLDKVFWPEEGYTKGDLVEYHRRVSPWMLPYLENRPLVMTRYPDGIAGKSFFQKDAPPFAPEWIRRVTLWSEGAERELSYFVAEDLDSLLYVVNLGTIPLHVWSSRIDSLAAPDWCVLDLDPKEAPFIHVVEIAKLLHALCEEIGLPSFVKTSGSSGLHVLIPLGRRLTYEQSRTLAQLLARVAVAERTDIATLTRNPARRGGKVYIDFVQNGHGRLLAAPFTVRPLPGAPVSAPLRWREVNARLRIRGHTLRSMPRRMGRMKEDPLRPVLELEPDLLGALERLTHWFD